MKRVERLNFFVFGLLQEEYQQRPTRLKNHFFPSMGIIMGGLSSSIQAAESPESLGSYRDSRCFGIVKTCVGLAFSKAGTVNRNVVFLLKIKRPHFLLAVAMGTENKQLH